MRSAAVHDGSYRFASQRVRMHVIGTALAEHLARAASLREALRARAYRRIFGGVLRALAAGGLHPIVLKGAALASTVYEAPHHRHCHDVDLLLPAGDVAQGAAALRSAGFAPRPGLRPGHVSLTDPSGLPIEFHTRLFRTRGYDLPWAELWERSTTRALPRGLCASCRPRIA